MLHTTLGFPQKLSSISLLWCGRILHWVDKQSIENASALEMQVHTREGVLNRLKPKSARYSTLREGTSLCMWTLVCHKYHWTRMINALDSPWPGLNRADWYRKQVLVDTNQTQPYGKSRKHEHKSFIWYMRYSVPFCHN